VFLAVPALQRNSRNNSTRQEAADILASVNDFVANNNGSMPTTVTCTNGVVSVTGAAGSNASETRVRGGTACNSAGTVPAATGTISIALNNKCNAAGTGPTASPRSFAALFLVETGASNTAPQCLES